MKHLGWLASMMLVAATALAQAQTESGRLYLEGREHLLEERFESAAQIFRRLVASHPSSEEVDDAQYWLGYAYEQLGRYEEAIEAFSVLLDRYPDSVRTESARSHRARLLAEAGRPNLEETLLEDIFGDSTSWELKRDAAYALARAGNFSANDILEEAMERESSSRQGELIRILSAHIDDPRARRVLVLALDQSRSTSVSIRALRALEPAAREGDVTSAVERLLASSASTSVKIQAVNILAPHIEYDGPRRALTEALGPSNSTSVQLLACTSLGDRILSPDVRPALKRVFEESYSTSVQLRCLQSLESQRNDPAAAEILRQAVMGGSNSTSVKLKAVEVAAGSSEASVRAAARAALQAGASTSVQLRAVRAFTEGEDEESAAETLESLFAQGGVATSVHIAALDALAHHLDTEAAPSALERALEPSHSTSVQLKALEVASKNLDEERVRDAVASALRSDNSTSVVLKAVDVLSDVVDEERVRRELASVLVEGYSTSVVLSSMEALEDTVDGDAYVQRAFVRLMEDSGMSTTARVRAGAALVDGADATLRARIADAMEEIVMRARRRGGFGRSDIIDDALDVLEDADPARVERLRDRSDAFAPPAGVRHAEVWPLMPRRISSVRGP